MSILRAAISREKIERAHEQAVTQDRKAEQAAVVAAIHAAFLPEVPELEKLSLKGDYGRVFLVPDAQQAAFGSQATRQREQFGAPYCTEFGLTIDSGHRINTEYLVLAVAERTDTLPLRVEIRLERNYPFKTEKVAEFHGHASVTEMLERFFETFSKYVADVQSAAAPVNTTEESHG